MIRWNTSNSSGEIYNGSAWVSLGTYSGSGAYSNLTTISGSSSGLSISAGGTNQNLTLSGSGTGLVTTGSVMTITNSTASTAYNNGALVISGGLGVSGAINSNSSIYAASSIMSGAAVYAPTFYGGTAASGNVTIDSTSDASKGKILLSPSGGSVGVGTSTPIASLDVQGSSRMGHVGPSSATTFSSAVGASDTTLNVVSTANYPSSGLLYLSDGSNNEVISYSGISGNSFVGVTRGLYGTTARTFNSGNLADLVVHVVAGRNSSVNPRMILTQTQGFGLGQVPAGWVNPGSTQYSGTIYTGSGMQVSNNNSGLFFGTSSAWVRGTGGSSSALDFIALGTNSTERIRIDGSGNVGIGTNSPTSILHTVASGAKTTAFTGNYLSNTATSSTASINKIGLDIQSTGTWNGTSAINTGLNVNVSGGTTNYAATFQGGNVGVGTATPGYRLDVQGSGTLANFGDGTTGTIQIGDATVAKTSGGPFRFQSNIAPSADDTRGLGTTTLRWNALFVGTGASSFGGNVGVGTTNPTERLSVVGSVAKTDNNNSNFSVYDSSSLLRTKLAGNGSQTWNLYDPGTTAEVGSVAYGVPGAQPGIILTNSSGTGRSQIALLGSSGGLSFGATTGSSNPGSQMVLSTSGYVGVGVTNPSYQLQLSTDSAAKPGTSTWTIASDERLKDIRAPFTRGLNDLLGLNTIYFSYKKNNPLDLPSDKEFVGIRAQDAQKAIPEAVSVDEKGYLHVTNDSIIWTAVNAVKELYVRIVKQDAKIADQARMIASKAEEKDLAVAKSRIQELERDNQHKEKELQEIKARLSRIEKSLQTKK